ncbi:Dipeptidyl aminopeptidases/acylaminoacyl-peptidases-like [hydrothermal vent metagenome]|uniref:Dipeptidyl aminopeptidases/acylaminoacyl-peptidases-like n=1 Tax=hydrothermal vent metagenome TaxID=652676 RepID=A0A3B0X348_9ZZZZ
MTAKFLVICICVVQCFIAFTLNAGESAGSLSAARSNFQTTLLKKLRYTDALESPPAELFSIIKYPTPIGDMAAYLGKADGSNKKQPAIIWLVGGFPPGGLPGKAWQSASAENDQSAKVYRQKGIVMMYPFLRGNGGNPGFREGFYGEVDDVLSALAYLKTVDYVDPQQIYLGGHSTGGTLALLVAESSSEFKAVFAFGPREDPVVYSSSNVLYDSKNETENKLRAPLHYLSAITSPTYIIEGSYGNIAALNALKAVNKNDNVMLIPIPYADHFAPLSPVNRFIADRIVESRSKKLDIKATEVQGAFKAHRVMIRETSDLQGLANIRGSGVKFNQVHEFKSYFWSYKQKRLVKAQKDLQRSGFTETEIKQGKDNEANTYYFIVAKKQADLFDVKSLFTLTAQLSDMADRHVVVYDGWGVN